MNVDNLRKMLQLETAAQRVWNGLSKIEQAAYHRAYDQTIFASETDAEIDPGFDDDQEIVDDENEELGSTSSWFKSLSPKQQAEYKKLHPGSKVGGGGSSDDDSDWSGHPSYKKGYKIGKNHAKRGVKRDENNEYWKGNPSKDPKYGQGYWRGYKGS